MAIQSDVFTEALRQKIGQQAFGRLEALQKRLNLSYIRDAIAYAVEAEYHTRREGLRIIARATWKPIE